MTPQDLLFMTLVVLKHDGEWHFMARTFNMKGPTFERLVVGFVVALSDYFYEHGVTQVEQDFPMQALIEKQQLFSTFTSARYATDVTFQMSFRPSGNIQEGKNIIAASTNFTAIK